MDKREIDEKIVISLQALMNNIKLYDKEHPAVKKSLSEVLSLIKPKLQEDGELTITLRSWYLYINGMRIKIKTTNFLQLKNFMELLSEKDIGGIVINQNVKDEEILLFLELLTKGDLHREDILKLLKENEVPSIHILPLVHSGEIIDPKKRVKQIYFETINLVKQISTTENITQKLFSKFTVGIYYLIDTLKASEGLLLGLTVVKNYDDYLYNHSVNVAILSLSIGVRIGLKSKELLKLGQSALLHDIGMTQIPKELLIKEGILTRDEWKIVKTHPIIGTEMTMDLVGLNEETADVILAVLEHQKGYDGSGYPEFVNIKPLSLFSRIIQISDFYDAVTTPRFNNPVPMSPAEAMAHLIKNAGKLFDPILSKFFVNLLGIYPLGTLVFLNTGEWGLVIGQPQDRLNIHKPVVLLIKDSTGKDIPRKIVDLSKSELEIREAESPWKFGIDPAEYFLE
ncbi:MAG TPA: HD domain-containing protein [Candidatus Atribacteria bacterium]|nr:HD domain-containing protein [Candidatus Atribacteria bacterium]